MKSRTKTWVIVFVAASVILTAVAGGLLFLEKKRLRTSMNTLGSVRVQLENSYKRVPFPNDENIAATRRNVKALGEELVLLRREMGRGQVAVQARMEPLEWLTLLTKTQRLLADRARKSQVQLPPDFAFGFQKYDDGKPPIRADVGRLSLQLGIVENVCGILYSSGIKGLVSINREQFEDKPSVGPRAKGESEVSTNEVVRLFTKEHFTLEFNGREAAVVSAMNALASNKLFIVVSSVVIHGSAGAALSTTSKVAETAGRSKDESGVADQAVEDGTTGTAEEADVRPREERIVCGRGSAEPPARVILVLDVYGFAESGGDQKK